MCIQVFVAADNPLPGIAYSPESPVFQSQSLRAESKPVLRLFSKPYVYDLTSVGGCACGFGYSPDDLEILSNTDVPAEVRDWAETNYQARRESVRCLRAYVSLAGTAEVYSCWIGDEEAEPETRLEVTPDYFGGDEFHLVEKQFLKICRANGE